MEFCNYESTEMIVTVAHYKGGVGKTTTAVHLAAYLQQRAPTLLLDGDDNRIALEWGASGSGFPFRVADEAEAPMLLQSGEFKHVVIDTAQKPSEADLRALAKGCNLMVIPAVPAGLDNIGLLRTLKGLKALGASNFRLLLNKYPPPPEPEGEQLRGDLEAAGLPLFRTHIPRLKAYDKAVYTGQLVQDVNDRNAKRAWAAFEAVGEELLTYAPAK